MDWPIASRKRLFLAAYLDFLLFGIPWTLTMRGLERLVPDLQQSSWALKVAAFLADA